MGDIRHIAYVDDDPDDHFIFSTTVKELYPDVKISPFYHCDDLLSSLQHNKPDLIFIDLHMPRKDGLECLAHLKGIENLNRVPVVICSTAGYEKIIDECYKVGANM